MCQDVIWKLSSINLKPLRVSDWLASVYSITRALTPQTQSTFLFRRVSNVLALFHYVWSQKRTSLLKSHEIYIYLVIWILRSKGDKLGEFCRYQSFRESFTALGWRIAFASVSYFSDLEFFAQSRAICCFTAVDQIYVDVNFLQRLTAAWNEWRKGTTGYYPWQMSETCRALVWHALQPSCLIRASS